MAQFGETLQKRPQQSDAAVRHAIPGHHRIDVEPPQAVHRKRHDGRQGQRQRAGVARRYVLGHGAAHAGLQPHPAALATDIHQQARLRLVQMREVVAGNGDAPAPAVLERRTLHLRDQLQRPAFQVRPVLRPSSVELASELQSPRYSSCAGSWLL
ncbi:hypothetical protein G6F22_018635 [Rhizopus arrhizus]|nr:hypothetical protein G6F22_018635 [Rhizopus arrhizus]